MPLDLISILVIFANIIASILTYGTMIFFLKRVFEKKLHADILVCVISFIAGCFFLLNSLNYVLLSNISEVLLINTPLMIVALLIPLFITIFLTLLLKVAFRPAMEKATAITYLSTLVSAFGLTALLLTLESSSIRWINGITLVYSQPVYFASLIIGLILSIGWLLYEMTNAANFLRKRLKESNQKSPDLFRLNLLSIAAVTLPLALIFPILPEISFFPVILQRLLSLVFIPIFALAWTLGWLMPRFLRKRIA